MNINIPWKAGAALGLFALSYVMAATAPGPNCELYRDTACVMHGMPTLVGVFHFLMMMGGFFGGVAFVVCAAIEHGARE